MKNLKLKYSSVALISIIIYSLFALRRIKALGLPYLNGMTLNNLILIIPIIITSLMLVYYDKRLLIEKRVVISFSLVTLLALFSLLNFTDFRQSIYAFCVFFLPMLLFFCVGTNEYIDFNKIISVLVFLSVIYAILTIVASFNYGTLLSMIGITNIEEQYNSQYRASLMIGSSITVSYYMNASLPLIFLKLYSSKKHRVFNIIGIILNITATLIENSRLAVITMLITILFCFLFLGRNDLKGIRRKVLLSLVMIIILIAVISHIDISRLLIGFQETSTYERLDAMQFGLYIFEKNPLFGKGVGSYFYRAWSTERYIYVDGISGLIDPHNTQILLLAEIGLFGTFVFYLFLLFIFIRFFKIKDKLIKRVAIIIFITYMIDSLGGTHIITEVSYSSIIWIIFGLFYVYYQGEKNENISQYLS